MWEEEISKTVLLTRKKFGEAIKELLKTKSFEDVSVTNICNAAGLTRQTFYSHFKDKYDLASWVYYNMCEATYRAVGDGEITWSEQCFRKLTNMKKDQEYYSEVYKSKDDSALLINDAKIVANFYDVMLEKRYGRRYSKKEMDLIKIYTYGATRFTAQWARKGMDRTPMELTELFRASLPRCVKETLLTEEERKLASYY